MFLLVFNSVSNFIVILFNNFPVFFVGFNVKVECESLVKIYEEGEFMIGLRLTPRERPREKHMLESEQSHVRLDFTSHFMTQVKLRVTHETHCLNFLSVLFLIPLSTQYKPTLPTKL